MLMLAYQVSSLVHGDVLAGWLGMIAWTRLQRCQAQLFTKPHNPVDTIA
jgi:hypothetical protein